MARDGKEVDWPSQLQDEAQFDAIRGKLIRYFTKKGCPNSVVEELADDAYNRWGLAVANGKSLDEAFLIGIARNVWREYLRKQQRTMPLEELPPNREPSVKPSHDFEQEDNYLLCLQKCLRKLNLQERELILSYYDGGSIEGDLKRARVKLAERFGLKLKPLRLRAMRLRIKIERCVKECVTKICEANTGVES